jgi:O-antigen/teichoic acid export membrane protein
MSSTADTCGDRGAEEEHPQRDSADPGRLPGTPKAAIGSALAWIERGNFGRAEAAYRWVLASGHPDLAPVAARGLGVLLAEQGDVAGAVAAFRQAIASRHADEAPMAAADLGRLLAAQGDAAGARTAYRRALASGHPDAVPVAARGLELLLDQAAAVPPTAAHHADLPGRAETDTQILGMARGAGLNLVGTVCSQLALLGVIVVLARRLGQADVGRYAQCLAFLTVLGVLSASGLVVGLRRFVAVHLADHDMGALLGTVRLAVTFVTGVAAALGAVLFVVAPWLATAAFHDPQLGTPLRFVAAALPAAVFTEAALAATQGFRTMKPYALISLIFEPVTRLVLTVLLLLSGMGLNGMMTALVISNMVAACLAAAALRRLMGAPVAPPSYDARRLFSFSMVSWVAAMAGSGLLWVDTILLGLFRSSAEVGRYNVATRLVLLATIVMPPISAAFAPRIADLYHRGQFESLRRTYEAATSWIVRLSLPGFVILMAFPGDLLALFGKGFRVAAAVTVILAVGKLTDAATGPCGLMLNMSGRPLWNMVNQISVLVLNVLLNLWLIPRYGIVGSAIAWAVSLELVNAARVLQVWGTMGMLPFTRAELKALLAAAGAFVVGVVVGHGLTPPFQLVVGAAVVVGVYFSLVILLGITAQDRMLLGTLVSRFRSYGGSHPERKRDVWSMGSMRKVAGFIGVATFALLLALLTYTGIPTHKAIRAMVLGGGAPSPPAPSITLPPLGPVSGTTFPLTSSPAGTPVSRASTGVQAGGSSPGTAESLSTHPAAVRNPTTPSGSASPAGTSASGGEPAGPTAPPATQPPPTQPPPTQPPPTQPPPTQPPPTQPPPTQPPPTTAPASASGL